MFAALTSSAASSPVNALARLKADRARQLARDGMLSGSGDEEEHKEDAGEDKDTKDTKDKKRKGVQAKKVLPGKKAKSKTDDDEL